MKKKQTIKPFSNSKKRKLRWHDIFITALAAILIVGFFVWFVTRAYQQEQFEQMAREEYESTLPSPEMALDHKLVCMASDLYHGTDQVAVVVGTKTYYGCNQNAVRELNTDERMRSGVDPYSKKSVDKALAFIAINSNKTGSILYFESEDNLRNYFRLHGKDN